MSLHQTERPTADVDDLAWEREAGVTWSIRRCAEVTGMPQSTLRTWERRYGLGPSARTAGGHRRYSAADLDRHVGRIKPRRDGLCLELADQLHRQNARPLHHQLVGI